MEPDPSAAHQRKKLAQVKIYFSRRAKFFVPGLLVALILLALFVQSTSNDSSFFSFSSFSTSSAVINQRPVSSWTATTRRSNLSSSKFNPSPTETRNVSSVPDAEHAKMDENCKTMVPGHLVGYPKALCVTSLVYLDVALDEKDDGDPTREKHRIVIGLFGTTNPLSAENFRVMATCERVAQNSNWCFKGDHFHRVVSNFVAQGGSHSTGNSIYGGTFREEVNQTHHSRLSHAGKGVVAWAEYPIGSQFYIALKTALSYLDGNHVVFGYVVGGADVLDLIHEAPRNGESPIHPITIVDCGQL